MGASGWCGTGPFSLPDGAAASGAVERVPALARRRTPAYPGRMTHGLNWWRLHPQQ
ncbi:hypothetical protein [Promicromonospora sp. NPDC050262]|uniref:hypothetical protein n=1 Tax=Promicromonospora sp. NPDC050262 TaxID=3155036 RepID=UPI0033E3357F